VRRQAPEGRAGRTKVVSRDGWLDGNGSAPAKVVKTKKLAAEA
jgi:hypothetical protein